MWLWLEGMGKQPARQLGSPRPFCVFLMTGACTRPSSNAIPILRAAGGSTHVGVNRRGRGIVVVYLQKTVLVCAK